MTMSAQAEQVTWFTEDVEEPTVGIELVDARRRRVRVAGTVDGNAGREAPQIQFHAIGIPLVEVVAA